MPGTPPNVSNTKSGLAASAPMRWKIVPADGATVAPVLLLTVNRASAATLGPMLKLPDVSILARSTCDPVGKMFASVVPAPDVPSKVNVDPAAVPPIRSGVVSEVVSVGDALHAGAV